MNRNASGVILMHYMRIGGALSFPPPLLTTIQSASRYKSRISHVTSLITNASQTCVHANTKRITAYSPTEADWAAVAFGVEQAIAHNYDVIGIENSNLSVVHGLIFPSNDLKTEYARHYRDVIQQSVKHITWAGIRWAPRPASNLLMR
jgi:hypothetical protein